MHQTFSNVIERMKMACKLKNDSAIARTLGMTPQAFSNYKKRGKIPSHLIIKFATIHGLSVDWLLSGEGNMETFANRGAFLSEKDPIGNSSAMNGEEIIYVNKLLKVLRGANGDTVTVIKCVIDSFFKVTEADSGSNE